MVLAIRDLVMLSSRIVAEGADYLRVVLADNERTRRETARSWETVMAARRTLQRAPRPTPDEPGTSAVPRRRNGAPRTLGHR